MIDLAKFVGACNEIKASMDKCFKKEKEHTRRANWEKAQAENEHFIKINARILAIEAREKAAAEANVVKK